MARLVHQRKPPFEVSFLGPVTQYNEIEFFCSNVPAGICNFDGRCSCSRGGELPLHWPDDSRLQEQESQEPVQSGGFQIEYTRVLKIKSDICVRSSKLTKAVQESFWDSQ